MLLLIIIIAAVAIFVGIKISKDIKPSTPQAPDKIEPVVVEEVKPAVKEVVKEAAPKEKAPKKATQPVKKPKAKKIK